MSLKIIIKRIITRVNCALMHVSSPPRGLYVGIGAKIDLSGGGTLELNENVQLMPYSMVVPHKGGRIFIGHNSQISMFSRIASANFVKIGNNVMFGPNIFVADYNHEYKDVETPVMYQGIYSKWLDKSKPCLEIDDDCWIGTNTTIVGNVHIGKHCVIGANSVVNSDLPDYSVAVGCPAKVIKRYDVEQKKWIKVV